MYVLPGDTAARLGGPLTRDEFESIKSLSRIELERAFSGLRIDFGDRQDGFWRIEVVPRLQPWDGLTRSRALPTAGRSLALGLLGGRGSVSFEMVASSAIQHARVEASRQEMLEGIGRGIGRTAAHEFAHQILGPGMIDGDDENTYEYANASSRSWYYGDLRWGAVWPRLTKSIGR